MKDNIYEFFDRGENKISEFFIENDRHYQHILNLIKDTPNDSKLGERIRWYYINTINKDK